MCYEYPPFSGGFRGCWDWVTSGTKTPPGCGVGCLVGWLQLDNNSDDDSDQKEEADTSQDIDSGLVFLGGDGGSICIGGDNGRRVLFGVGVNIGNSTLGEVLSDDNRIGRFVGSHVCVYWLEGQFF